MHEKMERRPANPPWGPLALTALVLAGAVASAAPLVDGVTGAAAPGARLVKPAGYVLLAPLSALLDALALLSGPQAIAALAEALVLFLAWRVWRHRLARTRLRGAVGELIRLAAFFAVLFVLLAADVLLPRPHARIRLSDAEELVVDFHSHTRHSHDGNSWFTVSRNRSWHRSLGYDVAYVTDHANVTAAGEARLGNPARVGEGITMLTGVEISAPGEHPVLLGVTRADSAVFGSGTLDAAALRVARAGQTVPIPLLLTLPGDMDPAAWELAPQAIELVDPTPRGLKQMDLERGRLVRLADSLGVPLIATSNNHGWNAPGVAWSVMRLPGWRRMNPTEVDRAIRERLSEGGEPAVRIVARRRAAGSAPDARLLLALPAFAWNLVRVLSPVERVAWLGWIWGVWLLAALGGRRAGLRRSR
jgi:hypothetical protein